MQMCKSAIIELPHLTVFNHYQPVTHIRERSSVLYLGMATEILNITIVMYHQDNGQRN